MKAVVHPRVYTMADRLALIAKQIDLSVTQPQTTADGRRYMLRDLAMEIVRGTPQHGDEAEDAQLGALFRWVAHNIEYRQDPADYDQYQTAGRTIQSGAGDCDCHVALVNALAMSLGFRTGAKVVSRDGNGWHIYSVVAVHPFYDPKQYLALDTSMAGRGSYPGWEPPMEERAHAYLCSFKDGRVSGLKKVAS